jgi:RimJ/RimL family protein N-acetyltransferase
MERVITTERLALRPSEAGDIAPIVAELNDFEVSRWLTAVPYPYSVKDGKWFINFAADPVQYIWGIDHDNAYIGSIGLSQKLSYWLGQGHWGPGIMSEAAKAVVTSYFRSPDAIPLEAYYFSKNIRSSALLQKRGFVNKGPVEKRHSNSLGRRVPHQKMELTPAQWCFLNPVEITT